MEKKKKKSDSDSHVFVPVPIAVTVKFWIGAFATLAPAELTASQVSDSEISMPGYLEPDMSENFNSNKKNDYDLIDPFLPLVSFYQTHKSMIIIFLDSGLSWSDIVRLFFILGDQRLQPSSRRPKGCFLVHPPSIRMFRTSCLSGFWLVVA
jgi:hypothetical protein